MPWACSGKRVANFCHFLEMNIFRDDSESKDGGECVKKLRLGSL
jgi:hypothetical protein